MEKETIYNEVKFDQATIQKAVDILISFIDKEKCRISVQEGS